MLKSLIKPNRQLSIISLIIISIILILFTITLSSKPYASIILKQSFLRISDENSNNHLEYEEADDTNVQNQFDVLQDILSCSNIVPKSDVHQAQNLWVLENYVRAKRQFKCHESVTLTTQGDFTFLDNLVVLVEKWKRPISVALYAPGDDFRTTLQSIAYLRHCQSDLVKEHVTFHIFFDVFHIPKMEDTTILDAYIDYHDCSTIPYQIDPDKLYKEQQNLTYPTNIAGNLARRTATTHFVFPIDIELYPSPNFIRKFLRMIANDPSLADTIPLKVFVLPLFVLMENGVVPDHKTELQKMIKANTSFVFHAHLCLKCHTIPKYDEWLKEVESAL